MAREAHLDVYGLGNDREKFVSVVEHFANLVAAAEREACAALCDKIADDDGFEGGYANHCALSIRERGAP
jgi:hypothetical protein